VVTHSQSTMLIRVPEGSTRMLTVLWSRLQSMVRLEVSGKRLGIMVRGLDRTAWMLL
jgi:hypothetical protein